MSQKKIISEKKFQICCDETMKLKEKTAKKLVFECLECKNKIEVYLEGEVYDV